MAKLKLVGDLDEVVICDYSGYPGDLAGCFGIAFYAAEENDHEDRFDMVLTPDAFHKLCEAIDAYRNRPKPSKRLETR